VKIFLAIIFSLIVLIIRIQFSDIISIFGISFNPIILLIYFTSIYWEGFYGLFLGFILGVIYGCFFSYPIGFYPLVFCSISFALILVREKIYRYEYRSIIILFISTFLFGFFELFTYKLGAKLFLVSLFSDILLESLLTTVVGFGILYIIKRKQ
jgi:cell shape-determining protein MreD